MEMYNHDNAIKLLLVEKQDMLFFWVAYGVACICKNVHTWTRENKRINGIAKKKVETGNVMDDVNVEGEARGVKVYTLCCI